MQLGSSAAEQLLPSDSSASGLTVAAGRSLEWHQAGAGTFLENVPQAFATREINAIAGTEGIDMRGAPTAWGAMRTAAYGILSGAACIPGVDALELRYVAEPRTGEPTRLRMYVTAKSSSAAAETAQGAVEAACAALPRGFTWAIPEQPMSPLGRGWGSDTVIELRRLEEVTAPQWDFIPTEFYYTINDNPGDGSGWPAFWSLFAKISRPIEVSLLFRATDLDPQEQNTLARITTDLSLFGHQHVDCDAFGNQVTYPADTNALVAYESWSRRAQQLQRPVLARIAIRGGPEAAFSIATALAAAIATSADRDGSAQPMYPEAPDVGSVEERLAFEGYDWLEIFPWGGAGLWGMDEAPQVLRRLPYLFGLQDAAGLAVLPVPDEQGAPGFTRARRSAGRRITSVTAEGGSPAVVIGDLLHDGQPAGSASLPLSAINRHVLVVGASGAGKTTTVQTMLTGLWREHGIPFLVIEPAKKEYRGLLDTPGMEELTVIVLGRDDISPLRLNPLAPPPGVRREVHSSAVLATLKMALPLFPPLPQLLEDALDRAYEISGWGYDTTIEDGLMPPTLRSLLASFETIFEREGYVGEARNIAAALRVRLKSLLRGSRGRILDTVESTDFHALMDGPVVVELDEVSDGEDKAILVAFLLDRIRATARARNSTAGRLRHVTVVEEAHRLLAGNDDAGRPAGEDTRADAVRAFCEAIRELRSQGEGFILSTQSPGDLARAAIATTGSKVIHRLETATDRDAVLDDIDASALDRSAAARLQRGEAIARWPDRDEPELIEVHAALGADSARQVDDDTVRERMAAAAQDVWALLPYPLCTRRVCAGGCDLRVRGEGQRVAAQVGPEARRIWADNQGHTDALGPIVEILARETAGDSQAAYCSAVHVAVAGDAFNVPRRVDIRPRLAAALKDAATEI